MHYSFGVQRFYRYPINGMHAYGNVGYLPAKVKWGGDTELGCGLCNKGLSFQGPFNPNDEAHIAIMEKHVHSEEHENLYRYLEKAHMAYASGLKSDRIDRSEPLRARADKLKTIQWKWHVYSLVMQYIVTPLPDGRQGYDPPRTDLLAEENFQLASCRLGTYEILEQLPPDRLANVLKSDTCTCFGVLPMDCVNCSKLL